MSIDERKLARQMKAADERRRRARQSELAEKAICMQVLRARHRELARPSRSDVERAVGYALCSLLMARPEGHPIRIAMEDNILTLLEKAGFDRRQANEVLQRMIETASIGQDSWLIKRETDRKLARLLAD